MRVLYAMGATLAGGGFGTTAYHGVRGLQRHGMLQRVLCGSSRATDLPATAIRAMGLPNRALRKLASYDRSQWVAHLQLVLFDRWAARHLEPADLFLSWYKCGLHAMRRTRSMGMLNISQWGSVHPRYQYETMAEEFARWGVRRRMPRAVLSRSLAEIDLADYLICPTELARDNFRAQGVPEAKLLTVGNGVDVRRFRPGGEKPPHAFRALFVGQVGFRKGVPYLLEAWRQLGWQDAELWLAGNVDPEIRPVLARFAGLSGVRFLGYVSELLEVYRAADLFVFPSLQEGSAKVNFEALACGLPVVTTPNAGSVARHETEGLLVPVRDPAALAAAIERLRADERLRREMAAAARVRAESFTWERHGDCLVEALRSLGQPRSSP